MVEQGDPANLISPKKLQPQTHLVQGNSTSSPGVDIALRGQTRSNKVIWGVHSRWWISSNVSTLYLVRGKIMVIWRKTRSYTSSKTPHITKQFSVGISYKVYDFDIQIYVWDMIEIIVSQVDFTIHLMLICILIYTMAPQSIFLNIFICWLKVISCKPHIS